MAKKKVTILGSGVGSLVTAYYLTTPEHQERYDVTIYQMGWRLGGKGASSRNTQNSARNIEEHGLHIWLGCYDNAFATIRRVYDDAKGESGVLPAWDAAFKPKPYTPVGLGDGHDFLQFFWPPNDDQPGLNGVYPSITAVLEDVIGLAKELLDGLLTVVAGDIEHAVTSEVHRLFERAHALAARIEGHPDTTAAVNDVAEHLHAAKLVYQDAHDPSVAGSSPLLQLLNLVYACIRGIGNEKYGILIDGDLNRIDDYEFCDWLAANGASKGVLDPTLDSEPFLRAFYDLGFFYEVESKDGAVSLKPNCAAGTALRCLIRIAVLYKGAGLYEMQAGMGEAVVMPLYKVLRKRGVKFEFFHKLRNVSVDAATNTAKAVELTVQARVHSGTYRPEIRVDALDCWPEQPDWSQLVDGERLKREGVNFESHWNDGASHETVILEHGRDFDVIVLGIALGALMKLNDEPSIVQEVIDASPAFRNATEKLVLIPTFAVQIWSKSSLAELGWNPRLPAGYTMQPPAGVGLVEPLDVWADMSHLLPLEKWPAAHAPASLHYFCGPLSTLLHTRPSTDHDVPAEADRAVKAKTATWFDSCTATIWPLAATPTGGLDNAVLYDITGKGNACALDSQYFRANIDPTECCVGSIAGSTKYRLRAHQSGITNIILAGAWTRTGYNTECVEAATMSGMAAARAILGVPLEIMGEHFLQAE